MAIRFKISVGQSVFLHPTGNNIRKRGANPVYGTIKKISRKHFYVIIHGRPFSKERFFIENFEHDDGDTNAGYDIYESEEAFGLAVMCDEMLIRIRKYFSKPYGPQPSFESVQKIHDLLYKEGLIGWE